MLSFMICFTLMLSKVKAQMQRGSYLQMVIELGRNQQSLTNDRQRSVRVKLQVKRV